MGPIKTIALFLNISYFGMINSKPIAGGRIASDSDTFRYFYIVSLQEKFNINYYQHFCGGTALTKNWILTAAHCVYSKNISKVFITFGENGVLSKNAQRFQAIDAKFNNFNSYYLKNDIALIKVLSIPKFINTNLIRTIETNINEIDSCKILGYGSIEYGRNYSKKLNLGKVDLITNEKCLDILGNVMAPQNDATKICAVPKYGDSCNGDSGGPLICSNKNYEFIFGIVSNGITCNRYGIPTVYTLINEYLIWINETIFN